MRRLVGQNVRRIREKRGLTQEQFAEISGFSQQYLSGLEGGHRNPTVVTVYELAVALGVSHMDLLRAGFASARLSPASREALAAFEATLKKEPHRLGASGPR